MIEDAKAEDNKGALRSFTYANDVEKIHAGLYQKALEVWARNRKSSTMSARCAA